MDLTTPCCADTLLTMAVMIAIFLLDTFLVIGRPPCLLGVTTSGLYLLTMYINVLPRSTTTPSTKNTVTMPTKSNCNARLMFSAMKAHVNDLKTNKIREFWLTHMYMMIEYVK